MSPIRWHVVQHRQCDRGLRRTRRRIYTVSVWGCGRIDADPDFTDARICKASRKIIGGHIQNQVDVHFRNGNRTTGTIDEGHLIRSVGIGLPPSMERIVPTGS